nr:9141_t:CDS:2 [Entrophospora candida]
MPLKKDRTRRNLDQNRSEICKTNEENIEVVVRCRDVLERETSSPVAITTTNRSITTENGKIFNFDKVLDKAANQEILFDSALFTKKKSHKKTNRSRQNGGYRHSSSLVESLLRDVLESETSSPVAITTTNRSIITENGKFFNFDKVLDKAANQEFLFDSALLYVRL